MKEKLVIALEYAYLLLLAGFVWLAPKTSLKLLKRIAKRP